MPNQQKMKQLKKKLKKQNVSFEEMEKIAERAKLSAVEEAVEMLLMLSLLVLRNMGWGKTRLKRFKDDFQKQIKALEEGYISIQDITQMIYEETGFNVYE